METDFSLGSAPAVADAASTMIMRRLSELVRHRKAFARWFGFSRQTEALKGAVHIFRLKATSDEGVQPDRRASRKR